MLASGGGRRVAAIVTISFAALVGGTPARGQDVTYTSFATGFSSITDVTHAGDSRLFVAQQNGLIRVVQSNGSVNPTPFLDISSLTNGGGERGLLGLAFHPSYASNGYFYVNYTNLSGNTVVARYSVSANPDVADAASAAILLTETQTFSNHNGGDIAFGPADGYLYIAFGDGGSGCDPLDDAQDPTNLLGTLTRIDVDGGTPYAIPPTNPFVGTPGVLDEIWAQGLRNPWRISFDREPPHDLWIGDVGQRVREEIDRQPGGSAGGENYGWNCTEGFVPSSTSPSSCSSGATCPPAGDTPPVHDYGRSGGQCSVTGGFVYRGSAHPGFVGEYFFADFCSRNMWSLRDDGQGGYSLTTYTTDVPGGPRTFGEDAAGELYVATGSTVFRLDDPTPPISGCPATPDATCDFPGKSLLTIRDVPPSGATLKDKLIWKSSQGPAESQAGFGNPTGNTNYSFCLYTGPSQTLVSEAGVSGGPGWVALGPKGYKFSDNAAAQDGTNRIVLRGDPLQAKTRLLWRGKNGGLPLPGLPLEDTDAISVRVHNDSNGNCWGADFAPGDIVKNDTRVFKAKTP